MLVPGILHFFIFRYVPMAYLSIAFFDYSPFLGITGSEWVGLKHFERFFTTGLFTQLLRNTTVIGFVNMVVFFPIPIVLAIAINEVRRSGLKRIVQTIVYLPHFLSWPVIASITYVLFTTHNGLINDALVQLGLEKQPFLMSVRYFHAMYLGQLIWKGAGFGTIIYLAAITGINPELYEAAIVDGASWFRRIWHITLPGILSTAVILFILRIGQFLEIGFEQVFLLRNPLNREVSEIFDTYVYSFGVVQGQYSYTAAIGVFTSIIGLVLVVAFDRLAKKIGEEGVM